MWIGVYLYIYIYIYIDRDFGGLGVQGSKLSGNSATPIFCLV